jgi:hypothetical protein
MSTKNDRYRMAQTNSSSVQTSAQVDVMRKTDHGFFTLMDKLNQHAMAERVE